MRSESRGRRRHRQSLQHCGGARQSVFHREGGRISREAPGRANVSYTCELGSALIGQKELGKDSIGHSPSAPTVLPHHPLVSLPPVSMSVLAHRCCVSGQGEYP